MLKWYGPLLCMGGDRGPKAIITWLLEGRKRERPEMKLEGEWQERRHRKI